MSRRLVVDITVNFTLIAIELQGKNLFSPCRAREIRVKCQGIIVGVPQPLLPQPCYVLFFNISMSL